MKEIKNKPKILMITPYLPYPPLSGGQTRSFNLLRHLAPNSEITLFSFLLPDQRADFRELKKYCRRIITVKRGRTWQWRKILQTGFSRYPFLVTNYLSPRAKLLLERELKRSHYDLIHVECFYLMPNVPRTKVPVLLVDQTIEFAVYQHYVKTLPWYFAPLKPWLFLDVAKIKNWEVKFWRRTNRLAAVSEEDQAIMERLSQRRVDLVPNGVSENLLRLKPLAKYRRPTILYGVANFKWLQNKEGAVRLLKKIWPVLRQANPQLRLVIAGRYAPEFIYRTGLLSSKNEGVEVKEVADKTIVYRRSWLLLAPMASGGGSRTKFFEAMALGLPIITTPAGIEGIRVKPGREVLLGKTDAQLIKLTQRALASEKLRRRVSQAARLLVGKHYSWAKSATKLYSVYQQIISENARNEGKT